MSEVRTPNIYFRSENKFPNQDFQFRPKNKISSLYSIFDSDFFTSRYCHLRFLIFIRKKSDFEQKITTFRWFGHRTILGHLKIEFQKIERLDAAFQGRPPRSS